MIEVKDLVKKYGDHVAVDHLSFTIEKGKIYGFLGPNGAGKSTTMNMITGYIASTQGEILIDGHNILEEPEAAKKCIGYLPELPPVYQDMTVREYLKFVAELKSIPKAEREKNIKEVMSTTKLEEVHAKRYAEIARRMGLAGTSEQALINSLVEKIDEFNVKLNIPKTLKDFGINEDEFKEKVDKIAELAVGDACTGSNPRAIDPAAMAKLLTCTYYGTEVDF